MDPLKQSGGDFAHATVKSALSAIPVVGGPAAEIFNAIIAPPLVKRRDAWIRSIAESLEALEKTVEGFKIDNLKDNEAFVTAVMQATHAAVRNHQQEKLEALRNAVLNVAILNEPDDDLQLTFLNFIDTLTRWHIRILGFFQGPESYGKARGVEYRHEQEGTPSRVLEVTFPEIGSRREFYDQIVGDLHSRGLMTSDTGALHIMTTAPGMFAKRTTQMGDRFLAFITSPMNE